MNLTLEHTGMASEYVASLEDLQEWEREVLTDQSLTYRAKFVLMALSIYVSPDWTIDVERSQIAKDTGIALSTLHKWWDQAIHSGWVESVSTHPGSRGQYVDVFRLVLK